MGLERLFWLGERLSFTSDVVTLRYSRVGKGISAQASHRTVRDSLPSYGSSNTFYNLRIVPFQVGKM